MKFKILLPIVALSGVACAQEYVSFTSFEATQWDNGSYDADIFSIDSTYYFSPKMSLGPFNEFEYINKASNLFGRYSRIDSDLIDDDSVQLGGEYIFDQFAVGGSYTDTDFGEHYTASFGYFINPDFLVKVIALKPDSDDTVYVATASYNHQINQSDYLGFSFSTDDEFDTQTLSSKYFHAFNDGAYLALNASYSATDLGDDYWSLGGQYYFNSATSLGVGYDEQDSYRLNARHFFNPNVSLEFAYSSNSDDSDFKEYSLDVTLQY